MRCYLDTGRCSAECLRALEEYNFDSNGVSIGDTYRYEERELPFGRGGLLQDFNGTGYRVMEYYNQDKMAVGGTTDDKASGNERQGEIMQEKNFHWIIKFD